MVLEILKQNSGSVWFTIFKYVFKWVKTQLENIFQTCFYIGFKHGKQNCFAFLFLFFGHFYFFFVETTIKKCQQKLELFMFIFIFF